MSSSLAEYDWNADLCAMIGKEVMEGFGV